MDLWNEMKMKETAVQPTQEYKSTPRLEIKSNKLKSTFLANAHRCPEENWLLEGCQAVPACPDISTIKMKISMEKCWNETYKQNIQSWCQPVCHKSHMDWLSFQTRPP
jgi:hypothetical protein